MGKRMTDVHVNGFKGFRSCKTTLIPPCCDLLVMTYLIIHMVDISSSLHVDTSIMKYDIEPRLCLLYVEPCKKTYSRSFECKCPKKRPACVGAGKYYDAKCIPAQQVMYGYLWIQPDQQHWIYDEI